MRTPSVIEQVDLFSANNLAPEKSAELHVLHQKN